MCQMFKTFVGAESGATSVELVTVAAAIVGFGLAAVAAVQTGAISLGGQSSTSTLAEYASAIAEGGPDVQMNGRYVYTPLSTRKNEYAMVLYELSGMSKEELSAIYLSYITTAERYIKDGDLQNAAKYLDIAGAAASVMKDYKFALPETELRLNQFYGQLRNDNPKGS
jgi:Flp pilus assembly pilin Flp